MTPEQLIQFKNLKNQNGEDLVGVILHELSQKTDTTNQTLETVSQQLARSEEEESLREMEERLDTRANKEVLEGIKQAIEGKNIDLSEVLAGLAMVAMEIRQGSDEAKALLQSIEAKEHTDIVEVLSAIHTKLSEEKPETPDDYTPIIESQKQGFADVVRILTEISLKTNEERGTESVKVEGEVQIAKPSWWKEYVLDWKPLEKLLAPIKTTLEKILNKKVQELPVKDGRVLVSLDQKIGGGGSKPSTMLEKANGELINPATEETLKKIAGDNYDSTTVDLSNMSNIVVTYKLLGSTVATETITKSGSVFSIVKT